jgi:hypothetical protein
MNSAYVPYTTNTVMKDFIGMEKQYQNGAEKSVKCVRIKNCNSSTFTSEVKKPSEIY